MTSSEIEKTVRRILVEDFEIEESKLVPEANLFADLDLDSIDAVDLLVRLQQETGKKVSPDVFKAIRTYGDIVSAIEKLMGE